MNLVDMKPAAYRVMKATGTADIREPAYSVASQQTHETLHTRVREFISDQVRLTLEEDLGMAIWLGQPERPLFMPPPRDVAVWEVGEQYRFWSTS